MVKTVRKQRGMVNTQSTTMNSGKNQRLSITMSARAASGSMITRDALGSRDGPPPPFPSGGNTSGITTGDEGDG